MMHPLPVPGDQAAARGEHLAEAAANDPTVRRTSQAWCDQLEALGGYPDESVRANGL